jgi:hypothetical protein
VQADGEGLDEGAAGVGDALRKLVAEVGGVVGEFHEGAVEMGEELGAAAELHVRADVVAAGAAEGAGAAGEADFEGDTVADLQACHVWSDGCDGARGFVAEAHGLAHDEVAIAAMIVVVKV